MGDDIEKLKVNGDVRDRRTKDARFRDLLMQGWDTRV